MVEDRSAKSSVISVGQLRDNIWHAAISENIATVYTGEGRLITDTAGLLYKQLGHKT